MSTDLRELPNYGIAEASRYLGVPVPRIRFWVFGGGYSVAEGRRNARPVVELPNYKAPMLSFVNLAELHVLDAIRSKHGVALQRVRPALDYLKKEFKTKHPLVHQEFQTDGLDLFVSKYGELLNISKEGRVEMKGILKKYLARISYDEKEMVEKLFPFTRAQKEIDDPKVIVIDPRISFGRPVLIGTGISTTVIAERYKAGDSIEDLANDYNRPTSEIQDAIRCELFAQAA